jgi:hypothetical protein
MKSSLLLITIAILIGTTCVPALAQTPAASQAVEQVSSKEDQALMIDSKKAIIATGISEPYFNEHFRLLKIVNEAGDRHVEWKYSVNEYETTLVDDVGYYTSPTGERVDIHSIKDELSAASDIKRTIPRSKADAVLTSCIGAHQDTQVVYRALKAPGKAGLYLTARSTARPEAHEEKDQEREIEGITFKVGFVDLESGKCTVKLGQVTP